MPSMPVTLTSYIKGTTADGAGVAVCSTSTPTSQEIWCGVYVNKLAEDSFLLYKVLHTDDNAHRYEPLAGHVVQNKHWPYAME